jgi:hypothetical protein
MTYRTTLPPAIAPIGHELFDYPSAVEPRPSTDESRSYPDVRRAYATSPRAKARVWRGAHVACELDDERARFLALPQARFARWLLRKA